MKTLRIFLWLKVKELSIVFIVLTSYYLLVRYIAMPFGYWIIDYKYRYYDILSIGMGCLLTLLIGLVMGAIISGLCEWIKSNWQEAKRLSGRE